MGEDFIYQQDGASCHTSQMSIEALENREIRYIEPHHWPPNSPDLNPLDYFFCSCGEAKLSHKAEHQPAATWMRFAKSPLSLALSIRLGRTHAVACVLANTSTLLLLPSLLFFITMSTYHRTLELGTWS